MASGAVALDGVVARYLDGGVWDAGFARVRCGECAEEFLVALSGEERGLCPPCGAKRGAELAAFLADEVVEEVGHAQWVFTVPKMLRFFFFRQRELLGDLWPHGTRDGPRADGRCRRRRS